MKEAERFRRFGRFLDYVVDLHKRQYPEKFYETHIPEECPICAMVRSEDFTRFLEGNGLR